jgi:hypothetical protein
MTTQFVPTHIRSAIEVVATDCDRTVTERDALARFADRISGLDVSSVDLNADYSQQPPAQTLVAPASAATESQLARACEIYRETVMGVPHYTEDYDDSLSESLAIEFGPEVATAMTTGDHLTPHLRDRLVEATQEVRESRHALLQGLNSERSALEAADEDLTRLGADIDDVLSARSFDSWTNEDLVVARDHLHTHERECDQLVVDRQATLHEQRVPSTHRIDLEFAEYLYQSLPVTYPVLTDIASLAETLHTARHDVERTLSSRDIDDAWTATDLF